MNTLIFGAIVLSFLFGFIYFLVKMSKAYEEEQKGKKHKKTTADKFKGGLR